VDLEAEDKDKDGDDKEDCNDNHNLAGFIVTDHREHHHNTSSSLHGREHRLEAKEDAMHAELLAQQFDRQARHPGEEAGRFLDPCIAQEFGDTSRHWQFKVQV
jgi:hypothetical protein